MTSSMSLTTARPQRVWTLFSHGLWISLAAFMVSCSGDQEVDGPGVGGDARHAALEAPMIGLTPVRGSIHGSLIPGLRATGGPEDLVLTGEYGKYIVERNTDADVQLDPEPGSEILPGALIDAQGARGGQDELVAVTTTLGVGTGSQSPVAFSRVRVADDTRGGAILAEADVARGGAKLRVTTRTVLAKHLPHLVVRTEVTNLGERRVIVRAGDRLHFGHGLVHDGAKGPRKSAGETRSVWLGYESPGQGYGYTIDGRTPFTTVFHVSERGNKPVLLSVDARGEPHSIAHGEKATFIRRVRVSSDGLPGIAAWAGDLAGDQVGAVRGRIVLPRRLDPSGFSLELRRGATALGSIPVKSSLAFDVAIPRGQVQLVPRGPWGLTSPPVNLSVNGNTEVADIRFPALGELDLSVIDGRSRKRIPATAVVVTAGGKPVMLGDGSHAAQAGPFFHMPTGGGRLLLPAGRYRLIFTRGTEYSLDTHEVDVRPGTEPIAVVGKVRRVMPTKGWVRAALRTYTNAGSFGLASPAELAGALICSGVEFAVTADRPSPGDLLQGAKDVGLESYITGVGAAEGEPIEPVVGHFDAFPSAVTRGRAGLLLQGTSPTTLLGVLHDKGNGSVAPFVTAVWPRTANKWGYFDRYGLSKSSGNFKNRSVSMDFDAVEVFSGEGLGTDDVSERQWASVTDWMSLISGGAKVTATAASGSKELGLEPVGLPFTYVSVGTGGDKRPSVISRAAVIAGLRAHRAVPTTGPLIELTVDGKAAGSTLGGKWKINPKTKAKRWLPHSVRIRVSSPIWAGFDRVTLYKNGEVNKEWEGMTRSDKGALVFDQKVAVTSTRDAWFMVRVTGSNPLPTVPHRTVYPHAISNPVWIDANRDGVWKMP